MGINVRVSEADKVKLDCGWVRKSSSDTEEVSADLG